MRKDKFDLFISYATPDKAVADFVVEKLESKGIKCFIAPRDMTGGSDYAAELISAIDNSTAVLLLFSKDSDHSDYVLREINSAVSRGKTIIPMRLEEILPSSAMEFYLGATHWLTAFPKVLDAHIDSIISIAESLKNQEKANNVATVIDYKQALTMGFSARALVMKEIELDYLCTSAAGDYVLNDETEGSIDDWLKGIGYEEETSAFLKQGKELKGFCAVYPVTDAAYRELISGEKVIRADMVDMYVFKGDFQVYIGVMELLPEVETLSNYRLFFDWLIGHFRDWKQKGISIKNIGISVYSYLLEKIVTYFGFEYKGLNPIKGKIYETSLDALKNNPNIIRAYGKLDL